MVRMQDSNFNFVKVFFFLVTSVLMNKLWQSSHIAGETGRKQRMAGQNELKTLRQLKFYKSSRGR